MDSIEDLFQYFEDEILSTKQISVISNVAKKRNRKNAKNKKNKMIKLQNGSPGNIQQNRQNIPIKLPICNPKPYPPPLMRNNIGNVLTENHSHNKTELPTLPENIQNVKLDVSIMKITDEGCIHEVAYSSNEKLNQEFHYEGGPAKTYQFLLDPFQKQAISCIDRNQSVLVSAHTSAGKTAVAEYAIARSLKNKQRVIYTTPIKALSNQKYRELLDEFKDVGLMTGDVAIEPSASCIVMTTEILRNMLYKGSEVTKEVGWVIFDEIHYMRDKVRGVVWEETLILLPKNVRYVFLSATIPNARQFAEWICCLHKQPCNVVYTDHRPTPLQHYLYPTHGRKLQLVIDEKGDFNNNNFDAAMAMLKNGDNPDTTKQSGKERSTIFTLVTEIIEKSWAPVIVFNFSKNDCETHALNMYDCDFNTESEKEMVIEIFNNAVSILQGSEKNLPHVSSMLPLLRRGIAFHHSGLLPIIKESIEILFGEGLIKVLYATETFSMGLNMPAKTVVFTQIKKFDGQDERYIASGEYIQMSGRAGRRGIDDKGIVVLIASESITSDNIKNIMLGKADALNSAFHLTDNMILNSLRQEEINPEYIIEKSFMQYQNNTKMAKNSDEIVTLQAKCDSINISEKQSVESYMDIKAKLSELHDVIREIVINPAYIRPFLQAGRLLKLKNNLHEYDWGILMPKNYDRVTKDYFKPSRDDTIIKINVMILVDRYYKNNATLPIPFSGNMQGEVHVFAVEHTLIYQISTEIVDVDQFMTSIKKKSFTKLMNRLKMKYPNGFPLLHPILDMNIANPAVMLTVNDINYYENLLINHVHHLSKDRQQTCLTFIEKKKIEQEIRAIMEENVKLSYKNTFDELQKRKKVLRELGYCDDADNISLKGRVACEFSTNELLLNEMIFHGILNKIPVNQCVALLSCLLCNEKSPELKGGSVMSDTIENVKYIITKISRICYEAKLLENPEDRIHNFQPNMIEVILSWCGGASFLDICNMTCIYEGSIIRYMRGIEEILRELYKAARNIGNIDLEVKFSEGIKRLKRGIVFAASLYL